MTQLPGFRKVTEDISKLKGIITIEKDDRGHVGINIPDCFSINNLWKDTESQKATGRNLLMNYPHSNILYQDAIHSLQSTGKTEAISMMGQEMILNCYTCEDYLGYLFGYHPEVGLFLIDGSTEYFFWKEDRFLLNEEEDGEVIKILEGLINVSSIQAPENVFPPNFINCFNNVQTIPHQMVISNVSSLQYQILVNSFNNIQDSIDINFHNTYYNFNVSDIVSCFGGITNGKVIFSEENFQELVTSGKIQQNENEIYVFNHNPNVKVYSKETVGDGLL